MSNYKKILPRDLFLKKLNNEVFFKFNISHICIMFENVYIYLV